MDYKELENIKRIALLAMFSDDTLMDHLVLKGGNALNIIYKMSHRASIDLDFSMEEKFESVELLKEKTTLALEKTFRDYGYIVFDLNVIEKPETPEDTIPDFWGGYERCFKIIKKDLYEMYKEDHDALRIRASVVGRAQKKTFIVQISKSEYCAKKNEITMDGYTVYVYTPEMIAIEKFRSICQQMDEYLAIVKKRYRTARSRDFFDIYIIISKFKIDLCLPQNIQLLKDVFEVKKVPVELLLSIHSQREFHRADFASLLDTVNSNEEVHDYDFYFDFVVSVAGRLCHTLGIE